jgi:hypothetical protein
VLWICDLAHIAGCSADTTFSAEVVADPSLVSGKVAPMVQGLTVKRFQGD